MSKLINRDNWPEWVVGIVLLAVELVIGYRILTDSLWLPCG